MHKLDRWINAAFGLLFVGLAIAILVASASPRSVRVYGAALGVGGLGVEALFSAAQNRRSWLSRLGPLP